VGGKDFDVVWKGEQFLLERVAEDTSCFTGGVFPAQKVGPSEIAHQQRPPREQDRRLVAGLSVIDQKAKVFGGVPWRMQHLEANVAKFQEAQFVQP